MTFKEKVIIAVDSIPRGRVVSYGQVAAACGSAGAARMVGGILHGLDGVNDLPWWRVINNQGRISIKGNFYSTPLLQKKLLMKEKVKVTDDFEIDIETYRFFFKPGDIKPKKAKK
jgi:methylated-DNA-protein-cysteine methyltransferase related protein